MADEYLKNLLGKDETIILVTRQHWFILFRSILVEIVLTGIVLVAVTALLVTFALPLIVLGFIFALLPLISMLRDILIWRNRKYIVTNLRVIQLTGIFNKAVLDSSLEKVNDVKMSQSFMGRIFDFGDIEILTASELGVNLFHWIGNPIRFKTAMLNAKTQLEGVGTHPVVEHEESIPELIDQLDKLRKQGVITEAEFQQKKADLLSKL